MSTCPTCGTKYGPNVRLCTHDGTVLEEDSSPEQQQVGKILAGKYRLDAPLSHGGMGVVYRATHVMLNKPVAVKLIKSDLAVSPDIARRFQREARAASNLNHPNIVAVYDLGQTEDGTLYIAMELVNGPSLKDVIKNGGPMDAARIVRILGPVTNALSLAHRHGIIHRDLKPQNIMLADGGGGVEVPKLLDFGIAKTFDESTAQLTATGYALGTPQYMSPEQALGKTVDARADIYSLGIIVYEMLVGEVPFSDQSTAAILVKQVNEQPVRPSLRRPDVSPALEAIAMRCMEKDPANRFASADDVLAALNSAGGTVTVPPLPTQVMATEVAGPAWGPTLPATAAAATAIDEPVAKTPPTVLRPATVVGTGAAPATHPTVPMPPVPEQPAAVASASAAKPPAQPAGGGQGVSPLLLVVVAVLLLIGAGAAAAWWMGYLPIGSRQTVQQSGLVPAATGGPTQPGEPAGTPATGAASAATQAPQTPPNAEAPAGQQAEPPAQSATSPNPSGTPEPPATGSEVSRAASGTPSGGKAKALGGFAGAPAGSGPANAAAANAKRPPTGKTPAPAAGGGDRALQAGTPESRPAASAASQPAAAEGAAAGRPSPADTPSLPRNPSVFMRCGGAPEVCASFRRVFAQALERDNMTAASSAGAADVVVEANATAVDDRTDNAYGASFNVRTYSLEADAIAAKLHENIRMPDPRSFSFDPRYGADRLLENTRAVANSVVENVREYWKKKQ